MFEDVEGDSVEQREVLRGVACPFSAEVFAETHIQHPVQLVFDGPVLSDGAVQASRIGLEAGDVEAGFAFGFARRLVVSLTLKAKSPGSSPGNATKNPIK